MQTAARALARSARVAVFTGAGASKESGIPTFREPETGLWARYDPMRLATPEAYRDDPPFVWSWYEHRFGVAAAAQPNPGHYAIAELEHLLPQVVVITQNIDGLHQRAGSSHVIELHGTMHSFRCIDGRHRGFGWDDFADQDEKPPRCPACGDYLRPEVVWFGEGLPPDALDAAQRLSASCEVMLIVGTSGVVYPAAAIPMIAREAGATVIDVNPERDSLTRLCDVFLQGAGGEVLPELIAAVRAHLGA
ncbi:MAG: NAD-dependent deacylase [Actinobacteria bacterium]|nr:NAD-dependent deacylase [Actinomycetota bacterium]